MSGCGTMVRWSGYGSTSWPDDDLAWLQELLGFHWREGLGEGLWSAGYGAFLDRGPETSRDEVDRMLIRGIDQFLPQVSKIEERESLLLYRLGAHARLGDLEATHAAAKQLSKPEKRAYGYSAVLQMLTPQEE